MACPVCGSTERKTINVRVQKDSDLMQVAGSTWDGRNMARCNECGVLYDHRYTDADGSGETEVDQGTPETINCPECGAPNSGTRDICSYCEEPLNPSTE